jgi:hypothetical protein
LQILLENLHFLKLIGNAGKMGKLFDQTELKIPFGQTCFGLVEFDQMESATSGGVEEEEEENEDSDLEIHPWIPSKFKL